MTSVRDPFDVLATHRPDEPTLQADWPSPRRAELLARVLDAAATPTTQTTGRAASAVSTERRKPSAFSEAARSRKDLGAFMSSFEPATITAPSRGHSA